MLLLIATDVARRHATVVSVQGVSLTARMLQAAGRLLASTRRHGTARSTRPRQPNRSIPMNPSKLQGEGDYQSARRYRESLERFIEAGRVEEAARLAAPTDDATAVELQRAEQEAAERGHEGWRVEKRRPDGPA